MANELTLDQQKAIVLAKARARAAEAQSLNQPQTIHTEDTIYDPVTGVPLSSPAYGPETTGGTRVAKNVLENVAAAPISLATGVARSSGAVGVPQLVSKLLGSNIGDQGVNALNQIEKGMEDTGDGYGKYAQKALNVTGQVAPYVMGGMVNSPLGASSVADKATSIASKIPALPSYAKNALGNFGLGGTSQLVAPEKTGLTSDEFAKEKLKNVAETGAINVALPAVGQALGYVGNKAIQGGKALIEPFYELGREKILGRALREAAGGETEKAIANLKGYKSNIPGVELTAGEVAGVPSLSATQRSVMATTPEATNLAAARELANSQARTKALENIASDTRLGKYSSIRENLADELYTPALNTAMDFKALSKPMKKEVESLANTPAIKRAMQKARENALNKGFDIGNPNGSLQGLHETKMALDREIKSVEAKLLKDNAGATSSELEGLRAAKNRLLSFIETVSPEYKTARETYARLSKPVEQLESIQKLAEKSISPKDQQIYAGKFFDSLEKLKKQGVLTERQIQRLDAIADDLRKVDLGKTQGKGVGSDTVQKLAYTNMLKQAGIPSVLQNLPSGQVVGNVLARASDALYGSANKQLTSKLAEVLMSPQETARIMEAGSKALPGGFSPTVLGKTITPTEQKQLAKILMMQRFQGE